MHPPEQAPAGLRRLAAIGALAALALVALGGAVRATDSGLACPTWPGCFTAGDFLPPADLHVWLEHSHRLFAGVVGLVIGAVAVWALRRCRRRPDVLWPAVTAGVLVIAQSLLGAVVVWRWLQAELVTAHLGLAMVIVACLIAVAVHAAGPRTARGPRAPADRRFARASAAVAGLALAQILVGGHVTGIGAGLAYRLEGFPLMDGGLFPTLLTATERQLYHAGHRWLGLALLAATAWLAWRAVAMARSRADGGMGGRERWIVLLPAAATGLVALQAVLGVANLWSGLSWVTVVPHLAVASWIWALLFLHALLARRRAVPAPTPSEGPPHRARTEAVR